jgi:hypothetical protein
MSAAGLLICASAAQHDLTVLHDDNDFTTAARYLPDLRERNEGFEPPECGARPPIPHQGDPARHAGKRQLLSPFAAFIEPTLG